MSVIFLARSADPITVADILAGKIFSTKLGEKSE